MLDWPNEWPAPYERVDIGHPQRSAGINELDSSAVDGDYNQQEVGGTRIGQSRALAVAERWPESSSLQMGRVNHCAS